MPSQTKVSRYNPRNSEKSSRCSDEVQLAPTPAQVCEKIIPSPDIQHLPSFIQHTTTAPSSLVCYLPSKSSPTIYIFPRKTNMCPSDPPTCPVRPSSLADGAVAVIHHVSTSQQLRLFFHNPTCPVTAPTHVSCQAEQPAWCGQWVSGLLQLRIQYAMLFIPSLGKLLRHRSSTLLFPLARSVQHADSLFRCTF